MNWGKGITIAIIAFMTYILSMVYVMLKQSNDLVEANYYEEGVNFEQKIQAERNSQNIKDNIAIRIDDKYISIEFPEEANINKIESGEFHFYRPENGSLDKRFGFSTDGNQVQIIEREKIAPGYYTIKIKWRADGKDYYVEKTGIKI